MLKNYFTIAWRNLWGNKLYSLINISGLTSGLAVGILILLWVQDELSYDRFHQDSENIYRVLANIGSGSSRQTWSEVPAPVATQAKNEVPGIKDAVRIRGAWEPLLFTYRDKQFTEHNTAYVDPSFFSVFDFKLQKGDPEQPFHGLNSVILTSSTAKRYFGDEDPVGKVLLLKDAGEQFVVEGVLEDFPENSSIKYDMLFPMSHYAKNFGGNGEWKTIEEDWGNYTFTTYLQLEPKTAIGMVETKLAQVNQKYKGVKNANPFSLQALGHMHLYNTDGSEGMMQTVRAFTIIAGLILLIAAINYVNLSTARSLRRIKEVTVRKVIGAGRGQLFLQFIIETALLFLFAAAGAFLLIALLLPAYNSLSGKNMELDLLNRQFWTISGFAVLFTLALSSIYPAWLLSFSTPLKALRGRLATGIRTATFRKILVTVQFVFSVALISGTLIIGRQLHYVYQKELGYEMEHIFGFVMSDIGPHYETVKARLLQQPGVLGVSSVMNPIVDLNRTTGDTDWDGKDPERHFLIHPLLVDEDFISLFKMQLVAGRGFSGMASDSSHYILNETAVKEAGITDPIGKKFKLWEREGTIIGVVKDFHFASLKQKIKPAIFQYNPSNHIMYVKTTGKDAPRAIAAAREQWNQYNTGFPFEYHFLDEAYDNLYGAEKRTGILFNLFSAVAILISCLGLFGLATYTAEVKNKEIGIRKVLGASVAGIVTLLSRDFIQLVLIAIVVAVPIAWYAMDRWLGDFAYRIPIEWWVFALAGLLAIVIALLTVSFQSVKAALMNPVKSLQSE